MILVQCFETGPVVILMYWIAAAVTLRRRPVHDLRQAWQLNTLLNANPTSFQQYLHIISILCPLFTSYWNTLINRQGSTTFHIDYPYSLFTFFPYCDTLFLYNPTVFTWRELVTNGVMRWSDHALPETDLSDIANASEVPKHYCLSVVC